MESDDVILIRPIADESERLNWLPEIGVETSRFLDEVAPPDSRVTLSEAAVSVLGNGIDPAGPTGHRTGLVVGYVQSGKTLSFETVAALARDNGYQMVILIAGISNLLLEQSTRRLRRDLGLDDRNRPRAWAAFMNPTSDDGTTVQAIRDELEAWRNAAIPPMFRRTVLITVLKHHGRLQALTELLAQFDMHEVPVLIIDDEADQASLNIEIGQGSESTTYRRLMALRSTVPKHTYLQYTATPQAPLLVSIVDSLSPDFVWILDPGEAYVGGREFFDEGHTYVRYIPDSEVPLPSQPLSGPPDTLLAALRLFMVGVTSHIMVSGNVGNRSMLVHPSHRTAQHEEFFHWVRNIIDTWKEIVLLPDTDPDNQALREDFRLAYEDLSDTVGDVLQPFEEVMQWLSVAFALTRVMEVNAREGVTRSVNWSDAHAWILVGGQAMDRGFTVQDLTVTYMPRGIGTGNADTVQQRARFFGYKRPYLGYCRLFLEGGTIDAYVDYVEHEEYMREELRRWQSTGRPLNEWKRAFVLAATLRPCRNQVLEFDYMRGGLGSGWTFPRIVYPSDELVEANLAVVRRFCEGQAWEENVGDERRTDVQRHLVAGGVPLRDVLEELLVDVRVSGSIDSRNNMGLLLQLSRALDDAADEACTVYRMSGGQARERSVDSHGAIASELFQGAAPVRPAELQGTIYPGDRKIRETDRVTVQIHMLHRKEGSTVVESPIPVVAVWVPPRLQRPWLIQDQAT